MARPRLVAAAIAVAALALAGCGSEQPDTETTPTEAPPGGEPMHEEVPAEPIPTAGWNEDAEWNAEGIAGATVARFVDEDAPDDGAWWGGFAPMLSDEAEFALAGTDRANVPGSQVTGEPSAVPRAGSDYLADVVVPTDAGRYLLVVSQLDGDWQVIELTPPRQ